MGNGEGEWTVVQYGRRRQRLPQQDRGWSDGRNRGMDRAPPGPFRRDQAPFRRPNQPVPPFRSGRYFGPQSRSYAAVVRGRSPGNAPGQQFRGPGQVMRQPADPRLGKLIRKMHAIIKVVHHLQNVAPKPNKAEPRMISRMVEVLASMIKPAAPSAGTVDLIRGNAKNWGIITLQILEDHYKTVLEDMLQDLEKDLGPDWRLAFVVAARWARRNLPHITQEVLDHAEAHITARAAGDQGKDKQPTAADPPAPQAGPAPPVEPAPQVGPAPQVEPAPQAGPAPQVEPAPQAEPTRNQQTSQTTRDAQQQTSTPEEGLPQRRRRRIQIDQDASSEQVIMEVVPCPQITEEEISGSQPSDDDSPQIQRQPRRKTRPGAISEEEDLLDLAQDIGLNSTKQAEADKRQLDWSVSPVAGTSQEPGPSRPETRVPQELVQIHHPENSQQGNPSWDDSLVDTSSSQQHHSKVIRHPTSERKMIEWSLTVREKWLILGDSNLARIPRFSIPGLQIDSYPGANFRHAQALMAKSAGGSQVEKVILSFGINCRNQRAKETSVKQLQAAVRTAKNQFPNAEIWIPVINYSCALPLDERQTLQTLNAHIIKNMPYIPALGEFSFQTQNDNVHWTRDTAQNMLKHWARILNLTAP